MYTTLYKYARMAFPSGRTVQRRLKRLLETQWLSPAELRALQLQRIKRLVEHAYSNVPFYGQRFREAGIHPNDIKTLDDFRRIPRLTRSDIQHNLESLIATNFPDSALHRDATGGSTGEPLRFYHNIDYDYWNWAAGFRVWDWLNVEPGCRQAWIDGSGGFVNSSGFLKTVLKKSKRWLKREKWLNTFDMTEDKMQAFAKTLERFQPELIFGCNSGIWLFARYLEEAGFVGRICPKAIIGGSEKLYDFQRELIEEVFGCRVTDYYGSREGGLMAAQCPYGSMHWSSELRYLEIIADGQPAEPGEIGEMIVTDLTNFAMPFIRYENGDIARLDDQPCPCGRGLPVLGELVGRKSDFFTTPEGRLISGLYFVRMLRGWPGVKKYQVHQPSVDKVEIAFEAGEDLDETWLAGRRQEFQAYLGESVQLSFKRVEHIPLTPAGKHLFTTSAVPVDMSSRRDLEVVRE